MKERRFFSLVVKVLLYFCCIKSIILYCKDSHLKLIPSIHSNDINIFDDICHSVGRGQI